jgi:hypothetical protein
MQHWKLFSYCVTDTQTWVRERFSWVLELSSQTAARRKAKQKKYCVRGNSQFIWLQVQYLVYSPSARDYVIILFLTSVRAAPKQFFWVTKINNTANARLCYGAILQNHVQTARAIEKCGRKFSIIGRKDVYQNQFWAWSTARGPSRNLALTLK